MHCSRTRRHKRRSIGYWSYWVYTSSSCLWKRPSSCGPFPCKHDDQVMITRCYSLVCAVWLTFFPFLMQSNARRVFNNREDAKSGIMKITKLGLVPILWALIIGLLVTYINSVIICEFTVFLWLENKNGKMNVLYRAGWFCLCVQHQDSWQYQLLLAFGHGFQFSLRRVGCFYYTDVPGKTSIHL